MMFRIEGLSLYHPVHMGTFHLWDTNRFMQYALHLARSFIQCHLSPMRSVHHPDNIEPRYPWLGSPALEHPVNSGAAA